MGQQRYKIYVNGKPVFLCSASDLKELGLQPGKNRYVTPFLGKKKQIHQYLDLIDKNREVEYVALYNDSMETTVKGVYVAGDSSGIEEASTAIIEGKIAGVSAAFSLDYDKDAEKLKKLYQKQLEQLRAGPFGLKPRIAKDKIHSNMGTQVHKNKIKHPIRNRLTNTGKLENFLFFIIKKLKRSK